jgi:hypothetical protein
MNKSLNTHENGNNANTKLKSVLIGFDDLAQTLIREQIKLKIAEEIICF